MGFGISNTDAIDAWHRREPFDRRKRNIIMNTDGCTLRIEHNDVVRRLYARHPFNSGEAVSWTMCGYETQSTNTALRAARVSTYADRGHRVRTRDTVLPDYPLSDTLSGRVQAHLTQSIDPRLSYLSTLDVVPKGFRAPSGLRGRPGRETGVDLDHPIIGVAAPLKPDGPRYSTTPPQVQQVFRMNDGCMEVYIPSPAKMSDAYACTMTRSHLRLDGHVFSGATGGADLEAYLQPMSCSALNARLELRVMECKQTVGGKRQFYLALRTTAITTHKGDTSVRFARTLATVPLHAGRWHPMNMNKMYNEQAVAGMKRRADEMLKILLNKRARQNDAA